jgi:hypothetical protein
MLRPAVAASPGSRMLWTDATDRRRASGHLRRTRSRGLTDTRVVGSGSGPLRCATSRAGSWASRRNTSDTDDHPCSESVAAGRGRADPLLRALREPDRRRLDTAAGRAPDVHIVWCLRLRPVLGIGRGSVPRVRRRRRPASARIVAGTAPRDGDRATT